MTDTQAPRTVAITGANGMVGSLLTRHFLNLGWKVHTLQRRESTVAHERLQRFAYALPAKPSPESLDGVNVLVHGAVRLYDVKHHDADRVNLEGARNVLAQCRRVGVPAIFLSSLSAHPEALSHYGRSKLAIESLCDPDRDLILRPGLVLATGGVLTEVVNIVRKLRVVPVVGGGAQPLQTILGSDLCRAVETAIRRKFTGALTVATPEGDTMLDLYRTIAAELGLRRWFVPVRLSFVHRIIRIAEALSLPVGVSSESFLGVKRMIAWPTAADTDRLGFQLTSLREAIAHVLSEEAAPPSVVR